jgi:hypothetical protein
MRSKLQELAGTDLNNGDGKSTELVGPSLQQLPKLGVAYADLYRALKIQESLYSTLTTEYEMAKVEEAKDTPKVRVLDPPDLPGKRLAPDRGLLIIGFLFFAFLLGCLWSLLSERWMALDPLDARKMLALSIMCAVQTDFRRLLSIFGRKN